ncbi:MAG TPA: pyridoxal-dependent decarboxylase [Bacillus sp. (in: firmicutes)]|nr:pyridoxal-dependent decarboxylase [Bacillus sp. (in: firmicutes)]
MKEKFLYDFFSSEQQNFLQEVLALGIRFMSGEARDHKVLNYLTNEECIQLVSSELPRKGKSLPDLFSHLQMISKYSIAQNDPKYLAFPDTGNSVASIAADILVSFLNQNLIAVDRSAPIASFIEAQLILWLRQLVGYPTYELKDLPNLSKVGGMWTSGGNMSNHIAILAALHYKFPGLKKKGLSSLAKRPAIVLAKGVEHFSFKGAAEVLGLGSDGLLWVESNSDYTTNPDAVRFELDNLPEEVEPFMVVAVAGNCRTTSIDSISSLRKICDEYGLWLHVDACHGGSLLFSDTLRSKVAGIEESDSVSLDPHKGMFVTYASSYVLFRQPETLAVFSRYPDKVRESDCFDLGLITPFYGSRGFASLKLWLLIQHFGLEGLKKAVECREVTYRQVIQVLSKTNYFLFLHQPVFYRSAFVFYPQAIQKYIEANQLKGRAELKTLVKKYTQGFSEELYRRGNVIFDLYSLQDLGDKIGFGITDKYPVMGVSVGHPFLSEKKLKEVEAEIRQVGMVFEEKMLREIMMLTNGDYSVENENATKISGPAGW